MKLKKALVCISITLCSMFPAHADECLAPDTPTVKCFLRRSDSRHKYMQTIASTDTAHIESAKSLHGRLQINVGYRSSFREKDIAECFFGGHLIKDECCGERAIKIQGSGIENRDPKAWLADYFYLPRNYDGSFVVDPKIKTFFADIDLYFGLEAITCGLYFRLHGPVVHSQWNLNFRDNDDFDKIKPLDHPHGYFSPGLYEGNLLVQTFADYAKGGVPQISTQPAAIDPNPSPPTGSGNTTGILNSNLIFQPLKYAKITSCSQKETGFADLRAELGCNFWQSDCHHVGLNLQLAAPTGKKKEPCFLFDAMIGNGNHWEVGGGLTAHYTLWSSVDNERYMSFHLDANITHMFKECIKRTFDLRNKPNSAYMLAIKFEDNTQEDPPNDQVSNVAADVVSPTNPNLITKQFAGEYAPVANLSTVNVDVSIGAQADIVAMLNYTCGGVSFDIGYNFWGRSCEKIDCPKECKDGSLCDASQANTWGLKGDARMFGYESLLVNENEELNVNVISTPLSATQSGATTLSGLNQVPPSDVATDSSPNDADFNKNIDTPTPAYHNPAATGGFPADGVLKTVPERIIFAVGPQINTSLTPVFLQCSDIDFTRTRGISHTVFANLSYTRDCECLAPYWGIGIAAEFAQNKRHCDDDLSEVTKKSDNSSTCGPCVDCAVSQWSVWLVGGVAFS